MGYLERIDKERSQPTMFYIYGRSACILLENLKSDITMWNIRDGS